MAVYHEQLVLSTNGKGTTEFTRELKAILDRSGMREGVATVFCRHTSCSLLIMENADPSVRDDLDDYIDRLAPENDPRYTHTYEGADDMPAHIKTALSNTSESIPFTDGKFVLGTWQGLFLWEFRAYPHTRKIWVTIVGE
jgi:secondary thiamine-phosphate synthase enzyme